MMMAVTGIAIGAGQTKAIGAGPPGSSGSGLPKPPINPCPPPDKGFLAAMTWSGAGKGDLTWFPGDYNGDGKTDMARWRAGVGIEVLLSTGSAFTSGAAWSPAGFGSLTWFPGDYNGDGKTDMARWRAGVGIEVLLSTGSSFLAAATWSGAGVGDLTWFPGDYNGDGMTDMARWRAGVGIEVLLSTRSAFLTAVTWSGAGVGDLTWFPGDYNGDGRTDMARWTSSSGIQVLLAKTTGSSFDNPSTWTGWRGFGKGDLTLFPGDYSGDGKDDMARWVAQTGIDVLVSARGGYRYFYYLETWSCAGFGDLTWFPGDYDGDGKTDMARWIGSVGLQVMRSTGSR
ncbi:MAG: VCBS repeat-containing protein [Phycisphaerales bacterium]|nr:VCBS repeat-containing protein [Phycisphaerales bacterium]